MPWMGPLSCSREAGFVRGIVEAQEFIVVADSKAYRVDKDKFLEWLSKDRDSSVRKKYLRRVLDDLRNSTASYHQRPSPKSRAGVTFKPRAIFTMLTSAGLRIPRSTSPR